MPWGEIQGHDRNVEIFRRAIARGRLASTFLFAGPAGVGKRMFALRLAQTLQCEVNPPAEMNPCGQCSDCRQVLTGQHPDIHIVSKPEDRAFIPLELLIGPKDNRQSGLCSDISTTPFRGKWKVAIVDDADYLNIEGANAMLKTLEEPPEHSLLILIGTSVSRQLPTIRSRCQVVRFSPLEVPVLQTLLTRHLAEMAENAGKKKNAPATLDPAFIPEIARTANGSLREAMEMADPDFWRFRQDFLRSLAQPRLDRMAMAAEIDGLLNATGKKVPAIQRNRIRLIMECAADFYGRLARFLAGDQAFLETENATRRTLLETAAHHWRHTAEAAAEAATLSLTKIELLQRNVHQQTLLEAWLDELVLISEDGYVNAEC